MYQGISTLQPVHHIAQTSNNTTLSLYSESLIGVPLESLNMNEGGTFLETGSSTSAERIGLGQLRTASATDIAIGASVRFIPTSRRGLENPQDGLFIPDSLDRTACESLRDLAGEVPPAHSDDVTDRCNC